MINPEQVVIDIIAENKASKVLKKIKSDLEALQKIQGSVGSKGLGNVVPKITNDANHIKEQIGIAQKALNAFNKTTEVTEEDMKHLSKYLEKILPAKSIRDAKNDLNTIAGILDVQRRILNESNRLPATPNFQLVGNSYTQSNIAPFEAIVPYGAIVPYKGTNFTFGGDGALSKGINALTSVGNPFAMFMKQLANANKQTSAFGESMQKAGKTGYSSFHQLGNLMVIVGGTITDLGTKIAGIFGAAGLGGMLEKMWSKAAERQTNMLYLIHQKGTSQAKAYYNEIMDIVAQLPGDDTFLTNILNLSSAMDKSIKIDKLKELGTAITDYYIASTMKGEIPFEVERDLRKYMTSGETRGLRNSIIAKDIDLLKNKNSILERGLALQKALERSGFSGMSEYESARNELEELKGHFQKAFADLGETLIMVTQPLMKFYNILDTITGSRVSQFILVLATAFITLFTVVGGGLIMMSVGFRTIEIFTLAMDGLSFAVRTNATSYGILNTLMIMSVGEQEAMRIAEDGNIIAKYRSIIANIKESIALRVNAKARRDGTYSIWSLIFATGTSIIMKVKEIGVTIKQIASSIGNAFAKWREGKATLTNALIEEFGTLSKKNNSVATMMNTFLKLEGVVALIKYAGATLIATIIEVTNTQQTFSNVYAHVLNVMAKNEETLATLELSGAVALLDALLAPFTVTILLIVGAILALVVVVEKLGEALGWWEDFGSMFEAISSGINRMWEAFINSDIVQAIIHYFQDFIDTLKDLFDAIGKIFGSLDNNFDIVQSFIDAFAVLEGVLKRIWNMLDAWANSPFGFVTTWMTPLGILLFHLDELGSFFEDLRDAIGEFTKSQEFMDLVNAFNEAVDEIRHTINELLDIINEIVSVFDEVFNSKEGEGTEKRIKSLVDLLKLLAKVIEAVIIPAIKRIGILIKIATLPLRIQLTVIKGIIDGIKWISKTPIGKFLGFSSEGSSESNAKSSSGGNINSIRNLGSSYNHSDNKKNVVINQTFNEGSMPIDARNMTKKEARQMFIGAFGYRRAVGYNGILK